MSVDTNPHWPDIPLPNTVKALQGRMNKVVQSNEAGDKGVTVVPAGEHYTVTR